MAKLATVDKTANVVVTSVQDLGYQYSSHADRGAEFALIAAKTISGFPDNVSDDDTKAFAAGCYQRKNELVLPKFYVCTDSIDTWAEVPNGNKVNGAEPLRLDVAYAMGYSQQVFGALKERKPNLHRLIGDIRTDANKYKSNRWNSLVRMYKALQDGSRQRSVNKSMLDHTKEVMSNLVKKNKVALSKSDASAFGTQNLSVAIAAFWNVIDGK